MWQGLIRAGAVAFAVTLLVGSTVASAATNAVGYQLIHQFKGPDGNKPNFMIQASDGNLYGTATFHIQTRPGTSSYVATITAYIGSLGESIPFHVVA